MPPENPFDLGPGETKLFKYDGEMVPNQIIVTNLSADTHVQFILRDEHMETGWNYFESIDRNGEASVWVNFPTNIFRVINQGTTSASLNVGGDGIFPYTPGTGQ